MILTFGSSTRAASQSVVTSGSSGEGDMVQYPFNLAGLVEPSRFYLAGCKDVDARDNKPGRDAQGLTVTLATPSASSARPSPPDRRRRARRRSRRPDGRPASVP